MTWPSYDSDSVQHSFLSTSNKSKSTLHTSWPSHNLELEGYQGQGGRVKWFRLGTTFSPLNFQHKKKVPHIQVNHYVIRTQRDIVVGNYTSQGDREDSICWVRFMLFYVEISRKFSGMDVARILRNFFRNFKEILNEIKVVCTVLDLVTQYPSD